MRSAPVIVLAEILQSQRASEDRNVEKPSGIGGPMSSTIPMALLRISARVVLGLRGSERGDIDFYSWTFAGPMHGGPRLFHAWPGTYHILFLRRDGGYLHTVGDYPAYDVELFRFMRQPKQMLPSIVAALTPDSGNPSDLFERIAMAQLRADLENEDCFCESMSVDDDTYMLAGLTSPFYIAKVLDSFCREFPNPFGRFAACEATAKEFVGRCDAFQMERKVYSGGNTSNIAEEREFCEADGAGFLDDLRSRKWPLTWLDYGWKATAERWRMDARIYASAMDAGFRAAACDIIATMPEARGISECASTPPKLPGGTEGRGDASR